MPKNIISVWIILVFYCSVVSANNVNPNLNELEHLPGLKVNAINLVDGETILSKSYDLYRTEAHLEKATESFSFPELDLKISDTGSLEDLPILSDPTFATKFMIDLHKAGAAHKAMEVDFAKPQGPALESFLESFSEFGTKAYNLVYKYPVVRLESAAGQSLHRLKNIINGSLTKEVSAGFSEDMLNTLFDFLKQNGSLFYDLNINGPNGLQNLIQFIEYLENLPAAGLTSVRSGLQTTNVGAMKGELFRMRRCLQYGLSTIIQLEKTASNPGYIWATVSGAWRKIDIVRAGKNIETKYYASITNADQASKVIICRQMAKDLYLVFKRIDTDGLDPVTALEELFWEFSKSSGITTATELKNQIKAAWTSVGVETVANTTGNLSFNQVKAAINAKLGSYSNLPYSNLDDLIDNSDVFQLIQ